MISNIETSKSVKSDADKKQITERIGELYDIARGFSIDGGPIGAICLNLKAMHDLAEEIGLDVKDMIDNVWELAPVHISPSRFKVPFNMDAKNLWIIEPEGTSPYYRVVQKDNKKETIVRARKAVCSTFLFSALNLQKVINAREEAAKRRSIRTKKRTLVIKRRIDRTDGKIQKLFVEAKNKFAFSGKFSGDVQNLIEEAKQLSIRYSARKYLPDIQKFLDDCLGFVKSESAGQVDEIFEERTEETPINYDNNWDLEYFEDLSNCLKVSVA